MITRGTIFFFGNYHHKTLAHKFGNKTCPAGWELEVFVIFGCEDLHISPHADKRWACWFLLSCRKGPGKRSMLWTGCDARQWFPGKGEGLSLKKQRSVGWEEANWESIDTLGDQRNCPVILLRRKVTGDWEAEGLMTVIGQRTGSDQIRKVLLKCFYLFIYNLFFGCAVRLAGS